MWINKIYKVADEVLEDDNVRFEKMGRGCEDVKIGGRNGKSYAAEHHMKETAVNVQFASSELMNEMSRSYTIYLLLFVQYCNTSHPGNQLQLTFHQCTAPQSI